MKRLSGGIDVGSGSHHIIILDEEDNFLYNQKVTHKLNEFTENIKLFKQIKILEKNFKPESITILAEIDHTQVNVFKKETKKILPQAKLEIKKDLGGYDRAIIISTQN